MTPVVGSELSIPFLVGEGSSAGGSGSSALSIRDRFPLRLLIGSEDYTFLLSESFTFSNVDPGGYEMASFGIPKDLPQILRGDHVKLDCGMKVGWEGRVKEMQRSLGAKTLIQCEGYGALARDTDLSMVFVDRDLTRWGEASRERQIKDLEGNHSVVGPSTAPDPTSGLPALLTSIVGPLTQMNPNCQAWYDAGSQNLISSIYYDYEPGTGGQDGGVNWFDLLALSSDALATIAEETANLNGTGTTGTLSPATAYRFARILHFYNASAGTNFSYNAYWRNLAMFGNHGLTKRGTAPQGFYTSDIVRWVADQIPGVQPGVIPEASSYVVPHAAYYTPGEAQQMIADMAKLIGYHWGVWESLTYLTGNASPRLDFRPYPAHGEWTAWALRQNFETLDIREDLSSQYNIAQVSYSNAAGIEEAIRVSVDNRILDAAEITERTIPLNLGTSTPAAAEAYGVIALQLLQAQARVVGSATLGETVNRRTGGETPAWLLKAGIDRLRIPDLPSTDVWGVYNELPITRVECSGSANGIDTSIEFGQGPNLLEQLTSELAQAAVLAG